MGAMTPAEFLDAILALPRLGGESVAPDFKRVAWSWSGVGPVADVWVGPIDALTPPVKITDSPQDSHVVGWTPDSRAVIVAEDEDGDERTRLFAVDADPPHARRLLTDAQPEYFLRGGKLAPDGRTLVYAANRDPATGAEIEPFLVWAHDVVSGARRVLARPAKPGTGSPQLNEQGTLVLYTRKDRHPAGQQVWLVGIDGTGDREVLSAGDEAKISARWLADGARAVVVAETKTHKRIGVWSRATGETRWLIDDPVRDVETAYAPRGQSGFVVVETRRAVTHARLVDADTGAESEMTHTRGTFLPSARLPDGRWVGTFHSPHMPRDVVRFRPDDETSGVSLTKLWTRTHLATADFVAPESIAWRSTDGLAIQGWLYRAPTPEGAKSKGLIVHVHGGPTAHSEARVSAQIQFLLRSGFDVLDPNYRGSTGFGLVFREAIKETFWGGLEQDDIRTGIEHLLREGVARAGRIGITGTSYGGYSSWCAITRWPREVLAAAAPICGMTDLVVDYETTRPDLRPYSEEMLGGSPTQVPARYRERSPIHFVSNIRGRLLIVQGERDPNVTPANVREVRAALDAAGIRYEVLTFPDEGHGIARPANQRVLYGRLAAFFEAAFASAG